MTYIRAENIIFENGDFVFPQRYFLSR